MKCRSCGEAGDTQSVRAQKVFGDIEGKKAFYECTVCQLIYMYPPLDAKEESYFYANEFEKFMEVRSGSEVDWSGPEKHAASNAENVLRRWNVMEKYCAKGANILEIGCSSGFMLDKFFQEGLTPVGIEPSGGFSKYLIAKNHEIYNNIDDLPPRYKSHFDVICHFFVLEHISDTRQFIRQKLELLRPGGVLFCEVPSATDPLTALYDIPKFEEFYWSIAHHYYFSPGSISNILSDLGISTYEIIPEQRYDLSNHLTWLREGIPGGQGRFDHVFSDKLNTIYKNDLIKRGVFDTFFLVIYK